MKIDLLTWTQHYIKGRDAVERKLKDLRVADNVLVATYKDRTVTFIPMAALSETVGEKTGFITVVCLQNPANFNTLLTHFSSFSKNPQLTIIFLNPVLEEKWLIKPAVHAAVADKASLKAGLQTLYQTVPPVH